MKKQWILIGTLVVALAIIGTVFGLNRDAGETVQGAISTNSNLTPKYYDEVPSPMISPEGWPHELFILRLNSQVPQTPNNVVYYDVPEYDGQPLPEGFLSDTDNQELSTELKTDDTFELPEDLILEGAPIPWENPYYNH